MEKTVRKVTLHDQPSDASYWRDQPPQKRLAALEQIRREYHDGVNANLVETTGEGVLPLTATRRLGLLLSVLV